MIGHSNGNGNGNGTQISIATTLSSSTNKKYGSIQNEESDDERNDEVVNKQKTGNNSDDNNNLNEEEKLAAIMRADPNIVRATDEGEIIQLDNTNDKDLNTVQMNNKERVAQQVMNDALEFESLLFSVRRTSARSRLLKLISSLKQLSAKFERSDEVKNILIQISPTKDVQRNVAAQSQSMNESSCVTSSAKRSRSDVDNDNLSTTKCEKSRRIDDLTDDTVSLKSNTETSTTHTLNSQTLHSKSNNSKASGIQPPLLKANSDYVKLHLRNSGDHCPDFGIDNSCPLGANCPRYHVFKPLKPNNRPMTKELVSLRKNNTASQSDLLAWYSREDLEKAYEKYRNIILSKECFSDKIKPDELNVSYYTCCFKCPVDNIVYFAQPFPGDSFVNGNRSSQGIWWYLKMKDAREMLATIVIRDLQSRNIVPDTFLPDLTNDEDVNLLKKKASMKAAVVMTSSVVAPTNMLAQTPLPKQTILPSTLPNIFPWNWAEYKYVKRCERFNLPQGCALGRKCPDAHVHIPKAVTTDSFPSKTALQSAYLQHYNVHIQDPFFQSKEKNHNGNLFYVKTVIDSRNEIWYTAAFTCPIQNTIFYAAGGTSGRNNSQGFVLYPSIEEAKLAVSGVVLNSFLP